MYFVYRPVYLPVAYRPGLWLALVLSLTSLISLASTATAQSTVISGAQSPQAYFPVDPCRAVDTRISSGGNGPVPAGTAIDIYVRGGSLPPQGGSSNCNVPSSATGVVVNIAVLNPTTPGHLRANRTGALLSGSPYSRINYSPTENVANEMLIELCNVNNYPADHEPCPGPAALPGTYADFQILNTSTPGTSVDIVVDVIGYTARMPLTGVVAGVVNSINEITPTLREFVLDNGLRVLCGLPYSDPAECNEIVVGWTVKAAGHVVNDRGQISVWAHGPVGVDQH